MRLPQKDLYHDVVKNALIKEGWIITHDPLILRFGERKVYVDLGAEAPIGAEKDGRKIAVEIKGFLGLSEVTDLERALGQYTLYRFLLRQREPNRVLFLAVTQDAYASIFDQAVGRDLTAAEKINMLVVDAKQESIVEWIE